MSQHAAGFELEPANLVLAREAAARPIAMRRLPVSMFVRRTTLGHVFVFESEDAAVVLCLVSEA